MDTMYWNLFWTTGMPEAWLMSRSGEGRRPANSELRPGGGRDLSTPLGGSPILVPGNAPGSSGNIY